MTGPTDTLRSGGEAGLTAVVDTLRAARNIAVMAHVNPDADAIGSSLALSRGLAGLGKHVITALSDPVPEYAQFLNGTGDIETSLARHHNFDLLVCVDSADIARIGRLYQEHADLFRQIPVVNIDHHRTNPLYGSVNYVDGAASSSSEICYHLLDALGAPIDADTATTLLFGIAGDTGSFQNGATTPGSLETAAALVRLGADNQRVAFQLFECKRFAAARLWGHVLSTIELDCTRRIVLAYVSQSMMQQEDAAVDETEGIAEYLRGIQDADVVMLLKETPAGEMRVSMRSRPLVDVSAIASALDGGGHRQAAGCTLPGPYENAKQILIETYDLLNPG